MRSFTWPLVGIVAVVTGGFIAVYYYSDTSGRAALIPVVVALGSAVTTVILSRRMGQGLSEVKSELEAVKDHVNGNTTKLIDKIPDAHRPAPEDVPKL